MNLAAQCLPYWQKIKQLFSASEPTPATSTPSEISTTGDLACLGSPQSEPIALQALQEDPIWLQQEAILAWRNHWVCEINRRWLTYCTHVHDDVHPKISHMNFWQRRAPDAFFAEHLARGMQRRIHLSAKQLHHQIQNSWLDLKILEPHPFSCSPPATPQLSLPKPHERLGLMSSSAQKAAHFEQRISVCLQTATLHNPQQSAMAQIMQKQVMHMAALQLQRLG